MVCPLNGTESFPSRTAARSHQLWRASRSHFLRVLIRGFLSRLWGGGEGGSGVGRGRRGDRLSQKPPMSPPPLCAWSHQLHSSQWEHGLWSSTKSPVSSQTMNPAPCCRRTMDPDKALGGCPNHRHKLGLRWQCWSPTPTHGSTAYGHQCGIRPLPTTSVVTRTVDAIPDAGYSRALNPDVAAMTPPPQIKLLHKTVRDKQDRNNSWWLFSHLVSSPSPPFVMTRYCVV